MPMYTKRLQVQIEDWMDEYITTMYKLHAMSEPECIRVLLSLGAGALESCLAGKGCEALFQEIGLDKYRGKAEEVTDIAEREKIRLISRIHFICRQPVEERMKQIRGE